VQKDASNTDATAVPTHTKVCEPVTRAQLGDSLLNFVTFEKKVLRHALASWVSKEFANDLHAVAAAAEEGNHKAALAILVVLLKARNYSNRGNMDNLADASLWFGLCHAERSINFDGYPNDHESMMDWLPISDGSCMSHKDEATAWFRCTIRGSRHELSDTSLVQFIVGLLSYYSECEAATKADILDSGRWIRKAAKQGLPEAQYELGEVFRHGIVCDVHMRFARKYIKRAANQGHAEAIARMKELRSCVMCGADDATSACARCHRARYCDATCSKKHWCDGGDVGTDMSGGASGSIAAWHKYTCPRTHMRRGVDG
jgi:hypothetical protein